jgi:hypothetical protein
LKYQCHVLANVPAFATLRRAGNVRFLT